MPKMLKNSFLIENIMKKFDTIIIIISLIICGDFFFIIRRNILNNSQAALTYDPTL